MIRPGFLDRESRQDLIELARDGSAAHRLARRTNALELLDDGMSCEAIAKVLLLNDDTIRTWHRLYEEDGIDAAPFPTERWFVDARCGIQKAAHQRNNSGTEKTDG